MTGQKSKGVLFVLAILVGLLLVWIGEEEITVFYLLVVFVVGYLRFRLFRRDAAARIQDLESKLEEERAARGRAVDGLARLIAQVELKANAAAAGASGTVPIVARATVVEPPAEPVVAPEVAEIPSPSAPPVSEPAVPLEAAVPSFASVAQEPAPAAQELRKLVARGLDMEEMLGTNWLSKVGIAILVLGIAFFLAWQVRELGPAGKIMVGTVAALALLGTGLLLERGQDYRLLARAAVAGGWSLLYFTAYAAHQVPAARVITSPLVGLAVLLLVAAGMVAHSLRYRAQVVTGMAFLLAFTAVATSRAEVFSLTANVVLSAGMAYVAAREKWWELEVFGILAAYISHFFWLRPIIEPMGGTNRMFPEFFPSAVILGLYWAVYRASYLWRRPPDERVSTVAAALNVSLLLLVMKYQSVRPELAFWFLLALGAAEMALAWTPAARRRRTPFVVLSTLGAAMFVAAWPFRYAADIVTPLWLIEGAALLAIGIITREVVFRRLGHAALAAACAQLIAIQWARVYGARADGAYVVNEWPLAVSFLATVAAVLVGVLWVPRRWPDLFEHPVDICGLRDMTYAAAVVGMAGAWVVFPRSGAAVGWMAVALVLAWLGQRYGSEHLTFQAVALAFFALLRTLTFNLQDGYWYTFEMFLPTVRLLTVSAVAAMAYAASRWTTVPRLAWSRYFSIGLSWAASGTVALLAWYELRSAGVALAWTLLGLMLFEHGRRRDSLQYRLQGYFALFCSFARALLVNFNTGYQEGLSPRLYTVLPIVLALFYVHEVLRTSDSLDANERRFRAPEVMSWLGVILVLALFRFEAHPDWVATTWAAVALVFTAAAFRFQRSLLLRQALFIAMLVVLRGLLHNIYQRSYFPPPNEHARWLIVALTAALLAASLPFAFRLRRLEEKSTEPFWLWRALDAVARRPEQAFFFSALLLVATVTWAETRSGMLTMYWGLEGVAVFLIALWIGERSFRLAGLGLLLLCVGKILTVDIWTLNIRDRALTFMVLGVSLVLVSVLYTRNRQLFRKYL